MRRRDAALAIVAAPFAAAIAQQPGRVARIGYLSHPTRESVERGVTAFVARLAELGWVEGKTLSTVYRAAEGHPERLAALAVELASLKPDVIFASAATSLPLPARRLTRYRQERSA